MILSASDLLRPWQHLIGDPAPPNKKQRALYDRVALRMADIDDTAHKFRRQLHRLIDAAERDPNCVGELKQRCAKAVGYFTEQIATEIVAPLCEHVGSVPRNKKTNRYVRLLRLVEESCWRKIERLYGARFLDEPLYSGARLHRRSKSTPAVTGGLQEKGATSRDTLELFRRGKTAVEIAAVRGLTVGTIKSHMERLIASGTIDVHDVLPRATIDPVLAFLRENPDARLAEIRKGTGDRYDYNDLRLIVAHQARSGRGEENRAKAATNQVSKAPRKPMDSDAMTASEAPQFIDNQ
jgi:DNA-binding CsgD family transcriptional regulator